MRYCWTCHGPPETMKGAGMQSCLRCILQTCSTGCTKKLLSYAAHDACFLYVLHHALTWQKEYCNLPLNCNWHSAKGWTCVKLIKKPIWCEYKSKWRLAGSIPARYIMILTRWWWWKLCWQKNRALMWTQIRQFNSLSKILKQPGTTLRRS